MQCNHCGFELEQDFSFCPRCGTGPQPTKPGENTAAAAVLAALKDNLFLILCILMSVSCLMALTADGLPLINILITVFLWLTYAQSRKDIADSQHLRCVSGAIYAQYVIAFVAAGLFLVLGVLLSFILSAITGVSEFANSVLNFTEDYAFLSGFLTTLSGTVVMIVLTLAAVILVVVNIFSLRYIHRFVKSVYVSIQTGVLDLKYPNAARIWLFVFGIFYGLSALGTLATDLAVSLGSAADCAVCIIASLLIRKYLTPQK